MLFHNRALLSLGLVALMSSPGLAQAGTTTREFRLEQGRLRFRAPADWHVLAVEDSGMNPAIVFHIRNSAVDSTAARCNVIVDLSRWTGHENTRALVDTLFDTMYDGYAVLGDTMPDENRRFLFWAGRAGDTPYSLFDDFARRGRYLVHVRIAWPLVPKSSDRWIDALSRDTRDLLASLTLDGRQLFPGWAAHPSVSAWGPGKR